MQQVQLSTGPVSGEVIEVFVPLSDTFNIKCFKDSQGQTAPHFLVGSPDFPYGERLTVDLALDGESRVVIPAGDRCLCASRMGNVCIFEEMDRAGLAGHSSS